MGKKDDVILSTVKPLISFIKKNPYKLNIREEIKEVKITPLGHGESNLSLLAKINQKYVYVFRIAQLYENRVKQEYETLKTIPDNLGSKPIYFDETKNIIPYPYLVESFISGNNISNWTNAYLVALARALARLHSKTAINKNRSIKFTTKLQVDNNYFLKNNTTLTQDAEIITLLSRVIKYLNNKENLLSNLQTMSLIHGDLNSSNIFLDNNKIRLIDWELAHHNDPAREFSSFYYDDMNYLNWRIKLDEPLKEVLLSTYQNEIGIHDTNFEERVRVWQIVDKAGAFIFCKWKSLNASENKEKETFENTTSLLKSSLEIMII